MQIIETNHLLSILVAIDMVFFVLLILFFKRLAHLKRNTLLVDEIETFEALIRDSGETAGQFNQQLQNKVAFIKKLNQKLDKRIRSLNLLLNRSNIVLSEYSKHTPVNQLHDKQSKTRRQKILKLANQGQPSEAIARKLGIPRDEVMLTLNMFDCDNSQLLNGFEKQMATEVNTN